MCTLVYLNQECGQRNAVLCPFIIIRILQNKTPILSASSGIGCGKEIFCIPRMYFSSIIIFQVGKIDQQLLSSIKSANSKIVAHSSKKIWKMQFSLLDI